MGDTVETVKDRLRDDIILKNYIEGEFYSKISVSDDALAAFYKEHEDKFVTEKQVKASHILVKEEKDIEEINTRIKSGEVFEDLAKEHSECPSGQNGGDLGFFGKGKMVPEFETVAFKLGINEVSDPFKTDFGYHILKVTDKQEEGKQSLEEVSANIKRHLEQVEAQKTISAKIVKLRAGAKIEIDEDSL
ncbi:MAG: peptidylprolyl isomerase [Spirochaetales bacterium]|nr:peptidylprolyl isomerase [Spirochaetales bacterium]